MKMKQISAVLALCAVVLSSEGQDRHEGYAVEGSAWRAVRITDGLTDEISCRVRNTNDTEAYVYITVDEPDRRGRKRGRATFWTRTVENGDTFKAKKVHYRVDKRRPVKESGAMVSFVRFPLNVTGGRYRRLIENLHNGNSVYMEIYTKKEFVVGGHLTIPLYGFSEAYAMAEACQPFPQGRQEW